MMIKKSKTNILFFTNPNNLKINFYKKISEKNKFLLSTLLYLGKKKFGRLGFRRKLIWRFFFRKQATKHYFRYRKYRFRFFKSKKFTFLLNKPKNLRNYLKLSNLTYYNYNLFNFIPRNNFFTILNNQQDFLSNKIDSFTNPSPSFLLLLKKKTPLKKTILNFFNLYFLYNMLYKFYTLKKYTYTFLKYRANDLFFKKTSILLLLSYSNVK